MIEASAARLRSQHNRRTLLNQIGWASVFLAPNFILVMLFTFIPALGGLALSTAEWDVFSAPKYVAEENYVELVDDDDFWISLRNTIVYTFTTVPVGIALSLVLALVLNRKLPGTLIFRPIRNTSAPPTGLGSRQGWPPRRWQASWKSMCWR